MSTHDAAPLSLAVAKAIHAGRASGKFNLNGKALAVLPPELLDERLPLPAQGAAQRGGQQQASNAGGPSWWETCEPSRLEASRNALTSIPDALCSWASLVLLDLSHNRLTQLPADLWQLQALGQLIANNNQLEALPVLPASLVVLHLQSNALRHVPPQCLAHCASLAHLDLSHNQLEGCLDDACVAHTTALTQLLLAHNRLQALPPSLGALRKLQVLHVEFNQLAQLPDSLSACRELVELHAGNNRLQQLPPSLACCRALRHLSVRDNQLSEWPSPLCGFVQLQCLDLQNNNLSNLPGALGNMTSLRALLLEGNGLRTIRRALITGPISSLLQYLRSRLPDDGQTPDAPPPFAPPQPSPQPPASAAHWQAPGVVSAPSSAPAPWPPHHSAVVPQRQPPGGYSTRPW